MTVFNFNPKAVALAAAAIARAQDPERASLRELFEDVAYDHYLERSGHATEDQRMTRAQFFTRQEADATKYHFTVLEATWWGFQAGFEAASIIGRQS